MKQEEMEMQLWEYLDGSCNEADRQRISVLIANDHLWQHTYKELATFHSSIAANLETEQPSMRFAKNVMEAVAASHISPATTRYINRSIIRGIAAFFIISISLMLAYTLLTANWNMGTPIAMPKLNLSGIFNSTYVNAAIGINIVLALILVDVVLRKKQAQH